jgi:signal recognition particle GTPase
VQGIFINNLYQYIRENNPDILLELEQTGSVTDYLSNKVNTVEPLYEQLIKEGKPTYIIEELSMNFLTEDLKPSRYNYILNILESDFEIKYKQFTESGILIYEITNMVKYCQSVFDDLNFSEENEDNRFLRYAITGVINEYVNTVKSENVSNELQQSAEAEG